MLNHAPADDRHLECFVNLLGRLSDMRPGTVRAKDARDQFINMICLGGLASVGHIDHRTGNQRRAPILLLFRRHPLPDAVVGLPFQQQRVRHLSGNPVNVPFA